MRAAPDYPHRPRYGSVDIERLVSAGGLFSLATGHDPMPARLWRDIKMVLFGVILGVGTVCVVVSAMVGRP